LPLPSEPYWPPTTMPRLIEEKFAVEALAATCRDRIRGRGRPQPASVFACQTGDHSARRGLTAALVMLRCREGSVHR